MKNHGGREPLALAIIAVVLLVLSGVKPHDYLTWLLEVAPIILALPLLIATYRSFPLTPLAYRLIFTHALILMLGGHCTYELAPVGRWLQEALSLSRNPYDRIGHLAQGFVPAIVTREILLRLTPLMRGGWLYFLTVSVVLAISAAYELFEWAAATALNESADAFLATQGDPWDTQWDMFLALFGANASLLLLSSVHDRALALIPVTKLPSS